MKETKPSENQKVEDQTTQSESTMDNAAEAASQQTEQEAQQAPEEPQSEPEPSKEDQLKEQLAAANDKYIRLQAEFDNYRKRTARERMDLVLTAAEDTIKGILPVLDDCERALQTLEQLPQKDENAVEGIKLIQHKLFSYLETKGLKIIESKGLELDTDKHSAIAKIPAPSKKLKGKIVEVVQQGYTLNGKVIRFANVVVGE